jgi:hypothetical protein
LLEFQSLETDSQDEDEHAKNRLHPLGVAACLCAGVALLVAALPAVAFLTRPVAGVGMLLGIAAIAAVSGTRPARQVFPVIGAVVSGLVLLVALFAPSLLGPQYEASRQKSDYNPETVRVIPLQLTSKDRLDYDGYVDAGRAVFQQGHIRVQVTAAVVGPVQVVDSKKRFTKQPYLAIGVRVQHLGNGPQVRFIHWDTNGERNVPAATASVEGRPLSLANTGSDVPVGVAFGVDLFPSKSVNDLLVFEAPTTAGPVRLELPAEAWGGKGTFKFQIPTSMIVTQTARKPGSPSKEN